MSWRWNLSALPTGSRSSLRRDAQRAIDSPARTGWFHRLDNSISQSEISLGATIAPLAILGTTWVLSFLLRLIKPTALRSLAPTNTEEAFSSLWQVHSAVVALSIPLLILLVEQARSSSVISTSVGQVLVSRTRVVFVTIISLGSVVTIGFSSLYLAADAVLLLNFALSSMCIAFILWGYWRALDLLLSPSRLRTQSQRLLEQRLAASMSDAFKLRWMDEQFVLQLAQWNPSPLRAEDFGTGEWSVARSTAKGRVIDVSTTELVALMSKSVPASAVKASRVQPTDRAAPEVPPTKLYFRSFGERVLQGDALLAVNVPVGTPVLESLAAMFTMDAADV